MCNRTSCAQVHELPQAIVVITGRAHCFYDYICIMPILLLWDLSTLCVVNPLNDHLYIYTYIYMLYIYIYIYMLYLYYMYIRIYGSCVYIVSLSNSVFFPHIKYAKLVNCNWLKIGKQRNAQKITKSDQKI